MRRRSRGGNTAAGPKMRPAGDLRRVRCPTTPAMGRKARRRVEAPWHWDPCTLWGYWRQPRLPEVRYDEIARTACEGDIVLFTSSGVWAWMQDFWTDSTVSHVGMVVREPGSGRLCLAESTLPDERVADVRTNTVRDGPMIVPLAARIRTYI
jgi:hypothetical protein